MKRFIRLVGELIYFFLLSVPLALTIYIVIHVGFFIYVLYKETKLLCQKITIK